MGVPLGRWGGEEMCMGGETWVILIVGEGSRRAKVAVRVGLVYCVVG